MLKKSSRFDLLLIIITITGIILRFYNIGNLHFSNDELSAYSRTNYNSFSDLITFGVKPDGHPALIQIFLYYYVRFTGFNEFLIKLPFLITGILTIPLSFFVAKNFFNKTTGYITASLISTLQFSVMYSQLARPYITGVFFILASLYFLHYFTLNKKISQKNVILYIIFAELSSLNHYFSLFTMLLLGIGGLLIVSKENIKKYIFANIIVLILFAPHLSISLHQLGLKGLNWLPKPNSNFFVNYILYYFNYCYILIFFIFGFFIYNIIKNKRIKKVSIIFISISIIITAVSYFYSIYRAPVLQKSILIFVVPLFLMGVASFTKNLNNKYNVIFSVSILIIGVLSLTLVRKHYKYMYSNKIYSVSKNISDDINSYKNDYKAIVFVNKPEYIKLYLKKFGTKPYDKQIIYFQNFKNNKKEINKIAQNSNCKFFGVATANTDGDIASIAGVKDLYKYFIKIDNYYFLLSKTKNKLIKKSDIIDTVFYSKNKFTDTSTKNEWISCFNYKMDSTIKSYNNLIFINAKLTCTDSSNKIMLVTELKNKEGKTLHWAASDYITGANFVHKFILLQDIKPKPYSNKTYLWNKSKSDIKLYDKEYIILKGRKNPYGLYENLVE